MSFTKMHERRVLKLAAMLDKSSTFDMSCFENGCGTPACVAGHGLVLFWRQLRDFGGVEATTSPWALARVLTGCSYVAAEEVYRMIFHSKLGCAGIGMRMLPGVRGRRKAAKEAAKYLREVFIPWAQARFP